MNAYQPDFVSDFAERTLINLERIEKLSNVPPGTSPKVYEFTQLVNSLLGLVMLPQETWFSALPNTELATMKPIWMTIQRQMVWDVRNFDEDGDRTNLKPENFREFAITLRNSIAHLNIQVHAEDGKIESIDLWNMVGPRHNPVCDFLVNLTKEQLREVAESFIAEFKRNRPAPKTAPQMSRSSTHAAAGGLA